LNWRKSGPGNIDGFVDRAATINGNLTFEGTFRIDGAVHGTIMTKDSLVVGPTAEIHADIEAGEAKIYGSVIGNISVSRRVEIGATGRVRGNVHAPQLVIEEGATFEGRSSPKNAPELRAVAEAAVVAESKVEASKEPEKPAGTERENPEMTEEHLQQQEASNSIPSSQPDDIRDQQVEEPPESPASPPKQTGSAEKKRWASRFL